MTLVPYIYFITLWIICIILWYRMSTILKQKEYKIDSIFMPNNYISFSHLIKNETNKNLRKKYRVMQYTLAVLTVVNFGGFFLLLWLFVDGHNT